jgi:hypothetical protein
MRKYIVVVGALVALAVPSAAIADPGFTGVSTNDNTNDVVGYAISAGNYNLKHGVHGDLTTRGEWARAFNAAWGPGAMADAIHGVQAQEATYEASYGPYAPPTQPQD